jgi:glucose/arabinose dehydrogenase
MAVRRSRSTFAAVVALAMVIGGGVVGGITASAEPAAAGVPPAFTDTLVAGGLSAPTAMAIAPDGRTFVAEQGGRLRVIANGSLLATPFLTVSTTATGERGLLGVTFDPDFATNRYVYVYYTATSPAVHNRLSRFTANGNVAVPGSERILLELDNLSSATNHNGGAIHFGPDGKLYVAVGENAAPSNAQSLTNLLGKMLRINSDGSIPSDNPFVNSTTGRNRAIWALGLRNPFTFSIQPGTGRMFINDVGQTTWEEINEGVAGANYGWPTTEGPTGDARFRTPVFSYRHSTSGGCAITGGAFYNPPAATFPAAYVGKYFYADYCAGFIRRFDPATGADTGFATDLDSPVDLAVGADGSLHYLARGSGSVRRIAHTGGAAPSISTPPADLTVAAGRPATFSVVAAGTPPLTYRWQRDGVDIPGATGASYTTAPTVPADDGATFRVIVSNAAGSVTSAPATLTVTAGQPPTGVITAPAAGATYIAGTSISYAGTGTDPDDGALPAGAFTWRVDFHHADHVHPFLPATAGSRTGSFTIPDVGETATNVWYRIILTVRDSAGLTHTTTRDVTPLTTTLHVETDPAGLQVTVDGQPRTTPSDEPSVVGMKRSLGAPSPQTIRGQSYAFSSWSDGGAATHTVTTPATPATYRATFVPVAAEARRITAVHSGLSLDVEYGITTAGARALQWPDQAAAHQRWMLRPNADGTYAIVNMHSSLCLDVTSASTADGARAVQWTCRGRPNQRWRVEDVGGGLSRIVSFNSGKCLDIAGASTAGGALAVQWTCHGRTNQQWRIEVP